MNIKIELQIMNYPFITKPGIYKLTNTINNLTYIGETSNLKARILKHGRKFRANGNNEFLQRDWNLGHKFSVEILEVMENSTRQQRRLKEEFYILKYKSSEREFGYNKLIGMKAGTNLGRKHSEETKQKISQTMKNRQNKN